MTRGAGRCEKGFTLIELMTVVAIVGILAAIALVSHRHFTDKAKAVEAEVALAEVNRLELLHHSNYGFYSDDLKTIGFSLVPALKYYQVVVHVQNRGTAFQAMALPLTRAGNQMALMLTRTPDGQVGMVKGDPIVIASQLGGASGTSGSAAVPQSGVDGPIPGSGGGQSASGCQQGGDATVGADGLLDMNFCLQSSAPRNK